MMVLRNLLILLMASAPRAFSFKPFNRRDLLRCASLTPFSLSSSVSANDGAGESESVTNEINDPFAIHFYGPVTDDSCFQLTQALLALDQKVKLTRVKFPTLMPHISLHIQSGGGSLMPTFFVCDTIKNLDTPVHIYVDGFCASAASLMVMSGDKRFMTEHSAMLIHQLSGSTSGKFNELKDEMSNLNFFMNNVKDIYLSSSKLNDTTLENLLSSDIWLDPITCLHYGLIDEIVR